MSEHRPSGPVAREYADQVFAREDVVLDGHRFERCRFTDGSRLIFAGVALPYLDACHVEEGVELVLDGAALRTIEFLAALCQQGGEGGRQTVTGLVRDLCDGPTWRHPEDRQPRA